MHQQLNSLIIILFFLLPINLYSKDYHFRHYDNEDGLSYNSVFCILQDSKGFMWFGTKNGLNRFDGNQFKTYRSDHTNQNSLNNNYIQCLHEGKNGLIWIGTTDGICSYNSNTDEFKIFKDKNMYKGSVINEILSDSKGNIWFFNAWNIFKVSQDGNLIDYYPAKDYFQAIHACTTKTGDIWVISTSGNIYKYDPKTNDFKLNGSIYDSNSKSHINVSDMFDAGEKGVLIATENAGMKLFDPNTRQIKTLFAKDAENKDIFIRKIKQINNNEFWLATQSGIHIYNLEKGFTGLIKKEINTPYTLADNAIYAITKDKEGGIWVGTYFRGIYYMPEENTPFNRYFETGKANSLCGSAIREICSDQYGNIWIGSENGGLNKYNPQTGKFKIYQFASDNIHGLLCDGNKLWIGTFDQGLFIMDIPSEKIITHYNAEDKTTGLKINFIESLLKTRQGEIYVGTTSGLAKYIAEKDYFEECSFTQANFIHHLMQDSEGILWISTLTGGLIALKQNGNVLYYVQNSNASQHINSLQVTNTYEDSNNKIWVTTRGDGIYIIDKKKQQIKNITTNDGLPSNVTYKVIEDGSGNLWITTANGLVCLQAENYNITTYSKSNGLIDNQFNYSSGYKDKSGRIYFGTINGMISFIPEHFKKNNFIAPIYITGFQINNKEIDVRTPESPLKQSIIVTKEIILNNNQSTFSIDFAALSYSAPETNKYLYKLEGADKEWNNLSSNRRIYYTNLPYGKYMLRIKSSIGQESWDNQEKTLSIIIEPPFYLTKIAFLSYAIVIIIMLYIFIKLYQTKRNKKISAQLQKLEDEKQKEIMRAKIDFFTNVAHEIRTPLTLIKSPLEKVIKTENISDSVREDLSIMQKNTDRLLTLTNQLLDFRKIEANSLQLNFVKTDICDLLQTTYLRFTPIAQQLNLHFRLNLFTESFWVAIDKEAVTKIFSNLFNNAIKYADSEVNIYLESNTNSEHNFKIRVNNDGKLIEKDMREKIFELFFRNQATNKNMTGSGIGLTLAKSLAELHNGKLYIDDYENYNSFVLELPINQSIFIDTTKDIVNNQSTLIKTNDSKEQIQYEKKYRILIIEDEIDLLNYLSNELSDEYIVLKATNGSEAISVLEKNNINLIISDIMMPVMDGLELCHIVKTTLKFSHIPVLLLTTKSTLQSRIEGAETGADAYVDKPFDMIYLRVQIQNLIKNRKLLRETYAKLPLTHIESISQTKEDQVFLEKLNALILENISDTEFGVDKLAEMINMSISSLYRKVKGISELNTVEFIKLTRLKKAAELLKQGDYRINEIAYMVGFTSPSYFTTSFIKQFGITPSQFAQQTKKDKDQQ